jgi:hypothetical protein
MLVAFNNNTLALLYKVMGGKTRWFDIPAQRQTERNKRLKDQSSFTEKCSLKLTIWISLEKILLKLV